MLAPAKGNETTVSLSDVDMVLEDTRAQLRERENQLVSARERILLLADVTARRESRIHELLQQLRDQQQDTSAMTSTTETLQRELQSAQQRCCRLESEHRELLAVAEREQSAARLAIEKSEMCTLQGYVLRACDEFAYDCPQYHQPTALPQVTRERAARLLSCLSDFTALSSRFAEYEQYAVEAGSSQQQAQQVFRKLSPAAALRQAAPADRWTEEESVTVSHTSASHLAPPCRFSVQ